MEKVLEKSTVTQVVKKLLAFYGTCRFSTMSTRAHDWSLSWATCIQSTPYHAREVQPNF